MHNYWFNDVKLLEPNQLNLIGDASFPTIKAMPVPQRNIYKNNMETII